MRERRIGGRAHTRVIFDRHAKLPIVSGSVPLMTGPTLPVHHNVARTRSRAPECESAAPGPSRHVAPAQSAVQLHCHEPTAIAATSPASQEPTLARLHSLVCGDSVKFMRSHRACACTQPHPTRPGERRGEGSLHAEKQSESEKQNNKCAWHVRRLARRNRWTEGGAKIRRRGRASLAQRLAVRLAATGGIRIEVDAAGSGTRVPEAPLGRAPIAIGALVRQLQHRGCDLAFSLRVDARRPRGAAVGVPRPVQVSPCAAYIAAWRSAGERRAVGSSALA